MALLVIFLSSSVRKFSHCINGFHYWIPIETQKMYGLHWQVLRFLLSFTDVIDFPEKRTPTKVK